MFLLLQFSIFDGTQTTSTTRMRWSEIPFERTYTRMESYETVVVISVEIKRRKSN